MNKSAPCYLLSVVSFRTFQCRWWRRHTDTSKRCDHRSGAVHGGAWTGHIQPQYGSRAAAVKVGCGFGDAWENEANGLVVACTWCVDAASQTTRCGVSECGRNSTSNCTGLCCNVFVPAFLKSPSYVPFRRIRAKVLKLLHVSIT